MMKTITEFHDEILEAWSEYYGEEESDINQIPRPFIEGFIAAVELIRKNPEKL